jgi:hypothetical protein
MIPKRKTITEGTVGSWIPVDRKSNGTIGFTVRPQTGAGGTYDVNFTESNLQKGYTEVPISRSTTTLTISLVNHGLTTSDDVILSNVRNGDYGGTYRVASVASVNAFAVTVADAGDAKTATVIPVVVDTVTDFNDVSGLSSGNIFASVTGVRVDARNVTTAPVDIYLNQVEP